MLVNSYVPKSTKPRARWIDGWMDDKWMIDGMKEGRQAEMGGGKKERIRTK